MNVNEAMDKIDEPKKGGTKKVLSLISLVLGLVPFVMNSIMLVSASQIVFFPTDQLQGLGLIFIIPVMIIMSIVALVALLLTIANLKSKLGLTAGIINILTIILMIAMLIIVQ